MKQVRNEKCAVPGEKHEGVWGSAEIVTSARLLVLTREELAKVLKISVRMVDLMVAAGEIPYLRIGDLVRFYLPDVVRALSANAVTSKRRCAHRLAESESPEVGR